MEQYKSKWINGCLTLVTNTKVACMAGATGGGGDSQWEGGVQP